MKTNRKTNLFIAGGALSTALLLPAPASAQEQESSFYIGAGAGYYRIEGEDFLDEDNDLRDDRTAHKAYLGTNINDIFGLEIGYIDFRESTDELLDVEADGYTVAATLGAPVGEGMRLYGKLGQLFWDQTVSAGPISRSTDGDDPFIGVGMRFGSPEGLAVRLEYERYELEDTEIDMPSVSLHFGF